MISNKEYSNRIWAAYPINDLKLNALGLCGEAGEFANKIKKREYKNVTDIDLIEELSDVLWHLDQCARLLNTDIDALKLISVEKTEKRNNK